MSQDDLARRIAAERDRGREQLLSAELLHSIREQIDAADDFGDWWGTLINIRDVAILATTDPEYDENRPQPEG